jgi:hypothetical protein
MNKTQRWPVIMTACLCGMALTAGFTDMMVAAANQDNATAAAQNYYENNVSQQQVQSLPSFRQVPWACTKAGTTWTLAGGPGQWVNGLSKADCVATAKQLNGG